MTPSSQDPRTDGPRGTARGSLFFVPLLLILTLLGLQCWAAYVSAQREARSTVSNLADVLTHSIDNSLVRIRADLNVIANMADGRDAQRRIMMIQDNMAESLRDFDAVLNYRVIDANGDSILGVGKAKAEDPLNVADRAWFQELSRHPETEFILSDVLISKVSGRPGLVFARPLRQRDGSFAGAAMAYIDLNWLQNLVDRLDIGEQGLVTLRHRDHARLILRRPQVVEQLNESNSGLYQLHVSTTQREEGEFTSAIDGLRRFYAFRALTNYPLTVVVALGVDDYLKPWYGQALLTGLVSLLLGAILVAAYQRLNRAYASSLALTEQLRTANRDLQRSNAELEEFAYIASHDLQTPLRNIASFTQLLERRYRPMLDQDGRDFIDFIVTNAARMSGLIQDLLAYARVSRPETAPEAIAASEVMEQVKTDLARQIAESGATVTSTHLPVLHVSRHQLASLLTNLVENALKYRDAARPPHIAVSARPDEAGLWRFSVADNGIGIAPEHWDRVFAIFQRLHTVDSYPGTGIGLALCRRIVHRWGGTIWVESEPGSGSTFHFTAPG